MEKYAAVFVYGIVARAYEDHEVFPMLKSLEGMSNEEAQVGKL